MKRAPFLASCGAALTVLIASCFLERIPPPAFRFSCEDDTQCEQITNDEGEVLFTERCIQGLCQYPCTTTILDESSDCPPDQGFLCFNQVCSHLCDPQADSPVCPAPQDCQQFTPPSDSNTDEPSSAGDLSMFGLGICGTLCNSDDSSACSEMQTCFEGVCLNLEDLTPSSESDST